MKYQDLAPPLSEAEFWIWYNEVSDRHRLVFELATSNLLNALFAAIPFVIMFIRIDGTENKKSDGKYSKYWGRYRVLGHRRTGTGFHACPSPD